MLCGEVVPRDISRPKKLWQRMSMSEKVMRWIETLIQWGGLTLWCLKGAGQVPR